MDPIHKFIPNNAHHGLESLMPSHTSHWRSIWWLKSLFSVVLSQLVTKMWLPSPLHDLHMTNLASESPVAIEISLLCMPSLILLRSAMLPYSPDPLPEEVGLGMRLGSRGTSIDSMHFLLTLFLLLGLNPGPVHEFDIHISIDFVFVAVQSIIPCARYVPSCTTMHLLCSLRGDFYYNYFLLDLRNMLTLIWRHFSPYQRMRDWKLAQQSRKSALKV